MGDDPKESETKTDDVYDLQMVIFFLFSLRIFFLFLLILKNLNELVFSNFQLRNVNFTLDVFVSEAIFSDTLQEFSDKMNDLGKLLETKSLLTIPET